MTLPDSLAARLDPVYANWLLASNPPVPAGFQPTLEQMRAGFARQASISNDAVDNAPAREDRTVTGRDGHAIPIRLYRHETCEDSPATCVFVHGGGWVLGNLDTHDGICVDLALRTGLNVVSVDYRLSPEHPFPAALHDTLDVLTSLADASMALGLDMTGYRLAADSAGASLAVSACLCLRDQVALPARLALIYPALGADMERPSFAENRDVPGLSPELMRFFFVSYVGGETLPDPLAAPLTVAALDGLPATFIGAAELDPLRDDATDFAARLDSSGTPVQLHTAGGLGHGYLWVRRQSPAARDAFTAVVDFLLPDTH
ncbi:MAG: alpha/beta hydrolase [Granulosicoccus sp.]|nr:alpha/beta hydrolase [Granulosicoccus sp.]